MRISEHLLQFHCMFLLNAAILHQNKTKRCTYRTCSLLFCKNSSYGVGLLGPLPLYIGCIWGRTSLYGTRFRGVSVGGHDGYSLAVHLGRTGSPLNCKGNTLYTRRVYTYILPYFAYFSSSGNSFLLDLALPHP